MDQRMIQTQTQRLILSPQIRQYLKLLQIPIQQLEYVLEQEVSENPALEQAEVIPEETYSEESSSQEKEASTQEQDSVSELDFQKKLEQLDKLDETFKESFYHDLSRSPRGSSIDEEKRNYAQSLITQEQSLIDYLIFQANMLELTESEKKIALELIGNTNEDGYLTEAIDSIAQALGQPQNEIVPVLKKLQTLDPPGVLASNLKECLLLQLHRKSQNTHLSEQIVSEHLPLLEKRDYIKLSRKLKSSVDRVKESCFLISQLEPKPGRIFYRKESLSVIPDAHIYRDPETEKFVIEMNNETLPQIRINRHFRQMLKDKNLDAKTKEYIKNKVNSALWLLQALEQRQSTLKAITEKLVETQHEFLDKGFSALKPLRLKDIADAIGVHESTVSRGISGKYLRTSQGTISYKSFFSTKMDSREGNESQKSVLEKIKNLVQNENSAKPLSDEKLVDILNKDGIKIARRTVAKYRNILKILPSHLRKYH